MKSCTTHLDEKLKDEIFGEARPDLRGFSSLQGTQFCRYIERCDKACFQNTKKYDNCRTRKFIDRYGENYIET